MLPPKLLRKTKRSTRWRSPAHLNHVRSFQCCVVECHGRPIEAAHVRLGSGAGIGQKPDDHRAVSLCKRHHALQHTIGEETFWDAWELETGSTLDQLIEAFCKSSPKRREIEEAKRERESA